MILLSVKEAFEASEFFKTFEASEFFKTFEARLRSLELGDRFFLALGNFVAATNGF